MKRAHATSRIRGKHRNLVRTGNDFGESPRNRSCELPEHDIHRLGNSSKGRISDTGETPNEYALYGRGINLSIASCKLRETHGSPVGLRTGRPPCDEIHLRDNLDRHRIETPSDPRKRDRPRFGRRPLRTNWFVSAPSEHSRTRRGGPGRIAQRVVHTHNTELRDLSSKPQQNPFSVGRGWERSVKIIGGSHMR